MYDELVERLKEDKSWVEQGTTQTEHEIAEHIQQAADAIEELTGFVQEAERDRDEYRERLDKANDAIEELRADKAALNGTVTNLLEQIKDIGKFRWIPVTERLPSENGFYLCLYNHNHPGGVAMDEGLSILQWFCGGWNLNEIYTVTHWMPLPTPPKEE